MVAHSGPSSLRDRVRCSLLVGPLLKPRGMQVTLAIALLLFSPEKAKQFLLKGYTCASVFVAFPLNLWENLKFG